MKRCRILKLLPLFLIIIFNVVFAAEFKGDWNGSEHWQEGWSEWSTTPSGSTDEVSMAVYLKPNWGDEKNEKEDPGENITIPSDTNCTNASYTGTCTVQKNNKSKDECDGGWREEDSPASCGNVTDGWSQETNGECSCSYPGSFTGSYTNGTWWCKNSGCHGYEPKNGCTIKCYWYKCPTTGLYSGTQQVCNRWDKHWYYNQTSSFADVNDKSNWMKSLSEAGGFARKVYIYSYPQRVYLVYDGNGADGTCLNADAHGITDDPTVCSAYGAGIMASGKDVFINYFPSDDTKYPGHRNLAKNEYYKTTYDFLGWSLDKNATTASFTDGQSITAQDLNANAGDTKTLYAIWGKHEYLIRYESWCGDDSALPHTYVYGSTTTLQALNLEACKTSEKSGYDYSNANTQFIGWYEDSAYNKKITAIPKEYHKDVTLYAKLVQSRSYDYPAYRWKWDR